MLDTGGHCLRVSFSNLGNNTFNLHNYSRDKHFIYLLRYLGDKHFKFPFFSEEERVTGRLYIVYNIYMYLYIHS